jgi:hypothetical protein
VVIERRDTDPPPPRIGTDSAVVPVDGGGHALLDRRRRTLTVIHPEPLQAEDLVHPLLARAGRIFGHWLGRHLFHAGVFAADGGAWALVGEHESGKSTMLAALALAGAEVIADDALVVEDGIAFAGPRCIDLRPPAPERLGIRDRVKPVDPRGRRRLILPMVPGELPITGWIYLAWGEHVSVEEIGARERVERLARACKWPATRDPLPLLDFAGLPTYELRRPRSWELVPATAEAVLQAAA